MAFTRELEHEDGQGHLKKGEGYPARSKPGQGRNGTVTRC